MISKVNGKRGFDPCRSETPENFITKIGHIYYTAGATRTPNFIGIGPGVSAPCTNSCNITCWDFGYLPFPFLSFVYVYVYMYVYIYSAQCQPMAESFLPFFFSAPTAKTAGRILSINTSNDAF